MPPDWRLGPREAHNNNTNHTTINLDVERGGKGWIKSNNQPRIGWRNGSKNQQTMAIVVQVGDGVNTQQSTKYVDRDWFERVWTAGGGGGIDINTTIERAVDVIFILLYCYCIKINNDIESTNRFYSPLITYHFCENCWLLYCPEDHCICSIDCSIVDKSEHISMTCNQALYSNPTHL